MTIDSLHGILLFYNLLTFFSLRQTECVIDQLLLRILMKENRKEERDRDKQTKRQREREIDEKKGIIEDF